MKTLLQLSCLLPLALVVSISCSSRNSSEDWERMSIAQRLELMRTDTAWIRALDSLAAGSIGQGARCEDAVKHTFRWKDRLWVYNQDWGGVLEIPDGFVPVDDEWQAELSYHGAAIFSPDSVAIINHYEGYQALSLEEFRTQALDDFSQDSLIVEYFIREETVSFEGGEDGTVIIVESLNADGIKGYFRYIHSSPESVEYSISLQYPSEYEEKYGYVREMIDRYPFGPDGQNPKEWL